MILMLIIKKLFKTRILASLIFSFLFFKKNHYYIVKMGIDLEDEIKIFKSG